MKAYVTEVIGTFFLVFTIGLTVLSGSDLAPIAIGAALMVMVYAGGHVSGAHYNPAVTLAVFLRGNLPALQVIPYWLAQIVGALLAGGAVYYLEGQTFGPGIGEGYTVLQVLFAEILFTFALCLVVLHSATNLKTQNNSFYGLAIGFTVTAGAFAVGPVSGGAFNPAVGVGPLVVKALAGEGGLASLWLYLVGPLVGGTLAAAVYHFQESEPPAIESPKRREMAGAR